MPTVSRLVRIQKTVRQKVISKSRLYKVGLHFLTQWRHSKHILILGPKCLRSEVSVHL